jgi:anaerobic nitric oxide reductase flavorubredoxin
VRRSSLPRGAFGCYGWSGESVKVIQAKLKEAGFQVIDDNVRSLWNPDESDYAQIPALVENLLGTRE